MLIKGGGLAGRTCKRCLLVLEVLGPAAPPSDLRCSVTADLCRLAEALSGVAARGCPDSPCSAARLPWSEGVLSPSWRALLAGRAPSWAGLLAWLVEGLRLPDKLLELRVARGSADREGVLTAWFGRECPLAADADGGARAALPSPGLSGQGAGLCAAVLLCCRGRVVEGTGCVGPPPSWLFADRVSAVARGTC